MTGESVSICRVLCPYVTYSDAKTEQRRQRGEAANNELKAYLEKLNPDPNAVAEGIDPVPEIYPTEFSDFGGIIGAIGDLRDEYEQKIIQSQRGTARLLRSFCVVGPWQRRRFGVVGQNIIRCSSFIKTGVIREERFLNEVQEIQANSGPQIT